MVSVSVGIHVRALTLPQYNKILTNQNKLGTDAEMPEDERSGED